MRPPKTCPSFAFLLAVCLWAAAPLPALAQRTYIEVGSPDFKPLPLAVAPFQGDAGAADIAAEMAQVVRGDLALSGLFNVLDPKGFLADPSEGLMPSSIHFERWTDVGAEGLVKADVRSGTDEFTGEFRLYEVRAGRGVLSGTVKGPQGGGRSMGHAIADAVTEYYTREPGIFRTRIMALRKNGRTRELVLFDVDGARPTVVYRDPGIIMLPAWRPDGRGVTFTDYKNGRSELWTLDFNNHRAQRLLAVGDVTSGGVYSSDGRRIAFTASRDGNSDVWVANADGTSPRRLTQDPAIDSSPSWSPDGKRLAFVSNRAGNPHIYIMNADGSAQRRLTFQGNYNQTPRWSPRGDLIAFTARDERRVFDIFTVAVEGGKIQRVTQDQGFTNEDPTWAPNGRMLAFVSDRKGSSQLVIASVDGDRQTLITRDTSDLVSPSWGPFPAK